MSLIPSEEKISDIYTAPAPQSKRYQALLTKFKETFGLDAEFVTRSPGRVNIIGEHIDYCYYSVLPMAIESDVVMAVSIRDDNKVILHNISPLFAPVEFELPTAPGKLVDIDPTVSLWANYFKCGHLVANQFLWKNREKYNFSTPVGMNIFVDGNVPTGGGLSSSAAFICASSLATLKANKVTKVTKEDLTAMAVVSERHVGVNTGGMDQSASVWGEKHHVLYVQFKPQLATKTFAIPETTPKPVFLVANTLFVSNKYETAATNYNLRVVEVTLAAQMLAKKLGVTIINDGNLGYGTLRGFSDAYFQKVENSAPWVDNEDIEEGERRLAQLETLVEEQLDKKDGYTTEEVANELGISVIELKKHYMTKFPVRYKKLNIYKRAKHVYSESRRVLQFLEILKNATNKLSSAESLSLLAKLGDLMNESQVSCDTLFNNSCSEIDEICRIARSNGSFGSRLTGAGWGGCTVHLLPENKVENVRTALINDFYKKKYPGITDNELQEALVVSEPAVGSAIYVGGIDGLLK